MNFTRFAILHFYCTVRGVAAPPELCRACVRAEGVAQGWCSADRSGNGACVAGDVTGSFDSSSTCFNTSDYWAWFESQCPGAAQGMLVIFYPFPTDPMLPIYRHFI
jgi:hypothetical protein